MLRRVIVVCLLLLALIGCTQPQATQPTPPPPTTQPTLSPTPAASLDSALVAKIEAAIEEF